MKNFMWGWGVKGDSGRDGGIRLCKDKKIKMFIILTRKYLKPNQGNLNYFP